MSATVHGRRSVPVNVFGLLASSLLGTSLMTECAAEEPGILVVVVDIGDAKCAERSHSSSVGSSSGQGVTAGISAEWASARGFDVP